MTAPHRLAWLPMTIAAALMVSVLAFLFARTQGFDDADYIADVALLRHIKQLDAHWELNVLKARIGISTHYDPLAASLKALDEQMALLDANLEREQHAEATGLIYGRVALSGAVRQKAALIERFKSNNSVLRNSLAFLPTAAEDVMESLKPAQSAPASRLVANSMNRLLLDSMQHGQSSSDEKAYEIQAELARLESHLPALAAPARERLEIFSSHVRAILREQKNTNDLLASIDNVQTALRIDELGNLLATEQQAADALSRQYRVYLLAFAAALVALLLYAAVHLVRGHRLINKVNRELQGVNETLEQRVQERTQQLRQAQSELVSTARQAGMAEIATNVLHNVGNILNSVNTSADLVSSTLRTSRTQGLARAVQLMNEHAADLGEFLTLDEKGKMLPGYLSGIAQALAQERQGMAEELGRLTRSVDHIKEVVATQQSYAGTASVVEPAQICELAEDALRMNGGALARHQVSVVKEFAQVPVAHLDRSRVLQILVNLISNAKQAMDSVSDRPHELTLRVESAGARLRVIVKDVGEGISAENLTRIFAHGFTTRRTGHGFGLHSCALAARQMGGTLTAHSDGPGLGAMFTLELPLDAALGAT